MKRIVKYENGNATVELFDDGTRVITTEDQDFNFEYPLNLDIRVSTRCSFGLNPETGKSVCGFCHESATTDGKECDYNELKETLDELPEGVELAIGCNNLTDDLEDFIKWCSGKRWIVNLTVNQGHISKDSERFRQLINQGYVKGFGISYRPDLRWDFPPGFLMYQNTVVHVILGIDTIEDVLSLRERGVGKILVLGEKDFGFNEGNVDLETKTHKEWYWWVSKLFSKFDAVSFDNLALEQLNLKRLFTPEQWNEFHQGEHSFYINAVEKYLAPSSRSNDKTTWDNISLREYFEHIKQLKNGM